MKFLMFKVHILITREFDWKTCKVEAKTRPKVSHVLYSRL